MLYRIDIQHFVTHAIDHFTQEELLTMQYAIISAAIKNTSKCMNVAKVNTLYPTTDIIVSYSEHKDRKIMEKMYIDLLTPEVKPGEDITYVDDAVYQYLITPVLNNQNVVIICDRSENDYIDVICKILKKRYSMEIIDLNELFSKGRVGPIYIDKDEIRNRAVDIRRASARKDKKELEQTRDGRMKLVCEKMSKKEKLSKLRELGIKVTSNDMDEINKILIDAWVDDDDEGD